MGGLGGVGGGSVLARGLLYQPGGSSSHTTAIHTTGEVEPLPLGPDKIKQSPINKITDSILKKRGPLASLVHCCTGAHHCSGTAHHSVL